MASKKNSSGLAGGILLFLGSLIYLYVFFTWYNSGGAFGAWLSAAQFLAPFVAVGAVISAITLFFLSIGSMAGKTSGDKMKMNVLWKFIILGGITTLILTAEGMWFYAALVGFILTYLGGMFASM